MFVAMKNSNIANNFLFSIQFLNCKHCSRKVSVTFRWDSVTVFVEYHLPVFVKNAIALIPSSDPVIGKMVTGHVCFVNRDLFFSMESAKIYVLNTMNPTEGCLAVLSAHSFASNWQLPFLNQRKGENGRRIYFMTKLHELICRTCGSNPPPPHTRPRTQVRPRQRARHP